jgi:hypothetical protein
LYTLAPISELVKRQWIKYTESLAVLLSHCGLGVSPSGANGVVSKGGFWVRSFLPKTRRTKSECAKKPKAF